MDRQRKNVYEVSKGLKDTSKYLLSFSETHYILNSQSYVPMKLYPLIAPCEVMKMSNCTQSREISLKLSPMCTTRENIFVPGDSQL